MLNKKNSKKGWEKIQLNASCFLFLVPIWLFLFFICYNLLLHNCGINLLFVCFTTNQCTSQCCIKVYFKAHHCTAMNCTLQFCTVLYNDLLHFTTMGCTVQQCPVRYLVHQCGALHSTLTFKTLNGKFYNNALLCTTLHCNIY